LCGQQQAERYGKGRSSSNNVWLHWAGTAACITIIQTKPKFRFLLLSCFGSVTFEKRKRCLQEAQMKTAGVHLLKWDHRWRY
jgi:hypothetical protein